MTSTPSLPAQIEAVRALIERYEDGKYCPPDVLAAVLVTLQQYERLEAVVKAARRLFSSRGTVRTSINAAVVAASDLDDLALALAALDTAAPETPT